MTQKILIYLTTLLAMAAIRSSAQSFSTGEESFDQKSVQSRAGFESIGDASLAPTSSTSQNAGAITSENTRQMSAALNSEGKRVFTAYATKLNAAHQVVVQDRNGNIVPLSANVTDSTLYHLFDKPLIFVKKPGSDSEYFLITQISNGTSDFLYRHTFDASRPGNGSLAEPLGEIIETNHLLYTNNNAIRYGVAVHATQNGGENNTTWMYLLRASATQVQLTAHVLGVNGLFGSSISAAPVNGTPIGRIKFSPDGRQLLLAYLPPAVVSQVQLAIIRRYNIGANGELSLFDEIAVSKTLLDFEFSPDGKYIYYAHTISESPQVNLKASSQAGNKFQIRRMNVITRTDEFVGKSYSDEIFNGKHLALQRSSNGKMYISAAGHRRMMVINDLDSDSVPVLSGAEIADSDPTKAPYLSGAFATTAFDHHFHTMHTNGSFYAARTKRQYELKDHLDNVNAVVSDMRAADGSANVVSANNYYPYGMMMPGRNYNSADYRYGFNGMEKDDEIKGTGNSYDFGARLYDPRVGRWLTRDPLAHEFAGWSDYNAFADNPILFVDPDGRAGKRFVVTKEGAEWLENRVAKVNGLSGALDKRIGKISAVAGMAAGLDVGYYTYNAVRDARDIMKDVGKLAGGWSKAKDFTGKTKFVAKSVELGYKVFVKAYQWTDYAQNTLGLQDTHGDPFADYMRGASDDLLEQVLWEATGIGGNIRKFQKNATKAFTAIKDLQGLLAEGKKVDLDKLYEANYRALKAWDALAQYEKAFQKATGINCSLFEMMLLMSPEDAEELRKSLKESGKEIRKAIRERDELHQVMVEEALAAQRSEGAAVYDESEQVCEERDWRDQ